MPGRVLRRAQRCLILSRPNKCPFLRMLAMETTLHVSSVASVRLQRAPHEDKGSSAPHHAIVATVQYLLINGTTGLKGPGQKHGHDIGATSRLLGVRMFTPLKLSAAETFRIDWKVVLMKGIVEDTKYPTARVLFHSAGTRCLRYVTARYTSVLTEVPACSV